MILLLARFHRTRCQQITISRRTLAWTSAVSGCLTDHESGVGGRRCPYPPAGRSPDGTWLTRQKEHQRKRPPSYSMSGPCLIDWWRFLRVTLSTWRVYTLAAPWH